MPTGPPITTVKARSVKAREASGSACLVKSRGGVDGLVRVRREAVVGVPHATVLPDPRSPCFIATAVPETAAKPNRACVRSEQMCEKQERGGAAQEE